MFYYSIFDLPNSHLQSHEICSVIALASFLFVNILNALIFIKCFNIYIYVSFGTYIFGDKRLQLLVHLLKLIMHG